MPRSPEPPAHMFDASLTVGAAGERTLDAHFGVHFDIVPASPAQQRQGIDRVFCRRSDDPRSDRIFTVEYKTDHHAARTGNAFVETVSVERGGVVVKPGWVYTTAADRLIYYIPGANWELAYILRPSRLRRALPAWQRIFSERVVANPDYVTRGLLVPLRAFEAVADHCVAV